MTAPPLRRSVLGGPDRASRSRRGRGVDAAAPGRSRPPRRSGPAGRERRRRRRDSGRGEPAANEPGPAVGSPATGSRSVSAGTRHGRSARDNAASRGPDRGRRPGRGAAGPGYRGVASRRWFRGLPLPRRLAALASSIATPPLPARDAAACPGTSPALTPTTPPRTGLGPPPHPPPSTRTRRRPPPQMASGTTLVPSTPALGAIGCRLRVDRVSPSSFSSPETRVGLLDDDDEALGRQTDSDRAPYWVGRRTFQADSVLARRRK